MSFLSKFTFGQVFSSTELPDIYPFPTLQKDFVAIDVTSLFSKLLIDTFERTDGIPDEQEALLWDNCVASESPDGLVTMLAKAMYVKGELYLVYNKALGLIRKATPIESATIRADYEKQGSSTVGVYITFKNYIRTDMLKIYSELEYSTIHALSKTMNLAKAIQLKMTDLRASVGLSDSADAKAQALAIAKGLADGKDVLLDAKDMIDTTKPDLTAVKAAMEFINQKRSFYLGMPDCYMTGESDGALVSNTGQGELRAIERGLKKYYFSIVKPVIESIFGIKTTFKTEDFDQLESGLNTLKTFDVTSNDFLSKDNKTIIVNKVFGLDPNEVGDEPEKEIVPTVTAAPIPLSTPTPIAQP